MLPHRDVIERPKLELCFVHQPPVHTGHGAVSEIPAQPEKIEAFAATSRSLLNCVIANAQYGINPHCKASREQSSLLRFRIEANGKNLLTRGDVVTDRQSKSALGSECDRAALALLPPVVRALAAEDEHFE
jgi:hypothetical protein